MNLSESVLKKSTIKKWIFWFVYLLLMFCFLEGTSFLIFKIKMGIDKSLPNYLIGSQEGLYPYAQQARGFAKYTIVGGYDPFMGYRLEPNSRIVDSTSETLTVLETDSFGFIPNELLSKERDYETKEEGIIRIFMLGGSTTAGIGAGSNEHTISAHLESELNAKLKRAGANGIRTFEVVNAGVMGYQTSLELIYLTQEILHFHPDFVICLDGINDSEGITVPNSKIGFVIPHRKIYHEEIAAHLKRPPPLIRINPDSSYLTWLIHGFIMKTSQWRRRNGEVTPRKDVWNLSLLSKNIAIFEKNLQTLSGVAYGHNLKMILVLQPNLYSKKSRAPSEVLFFSKWISFRYKEMEKWFSVLESSYEKLSRKNRNPNVNYLSLAKIFDDVKDQIYVDQAHYNSMGNKRIAKALADQIFVMYET